MVPRWSFAARFSASCCDARGGTRRTSSPRRWSSFQTASLPLGQVNASELRDQCLSFTGAEETFPFGPRTSVFKVAGKMFALSQLAADSLRVSLKCEPDLADALREAHAAVLPGYHLNKRHWNTVIVDGSLADDAIRDRGASNTRLIMKPYSATEPPVEVVEAVRPERAVPLEPLCSVAERLTPQPRRAQLCCSAALDQPGALEHAQVLRHRLDRDRKRLGELVDGRLAGCEPLEDRPPRRISQRGASRARDPPDDDPECTRFQRPLLERGSRLLLPLSFGPAMYPSSDIDM